MELVRACAGRERRPRALDGDRAPPGADRARVRRTCRADQARRPAWSGDREIPPEAFVRRRTEGRTVDASGPAWTAVADAVDALSAGSPAAGEGPGPVGVRHGATAYYVAPRAPVGLGDVGTRLGKETPLLYVRHRGCRGDPGGSPPWGGGRGSEGGEVEPASIFHPRRRTWPWVLLAAVALYLLLPRPKRGARHVALAPERPPSRCRTSSARCRFAVFFGLSLVGIASQMATTAATPGGRLADADADRLWAMSLFGPGSSPSQPTTPRCASDCCPTDWSVSPSPVRPRVPTRRSRPSRSAPRRRRRRRVGSVGSSASSTGAVRTHAPRQEP